MKTPFLLLLLSVLPLSTVAQLYFPPNNSNEWETTDPSQLNWCPEKIDELYQFLADNDTKAFILLKDGKIVLEQYFGGFTAESNWYWASAGKTLTAVMTGIAQQEGFLDIHNPTSDYLGAGWTSCTPAQEAAITVWNQLTMTSGLDDGVADPYCTDPACLQYLADPGTRWAYHNGPYTLLDGVIENATGQTLNLYTQQKLKSVTGMDGLYLPSGYNNVFWSTPRSMARFGLFILNEGNWDGTQVLTDTAYFDQMVNTSQNLNLSYGYLWWLNGKESFMLPSTQVVFPGSLISNAPDDMISGLGADGQFVNVIPSQNMVWIRMGEDPSSVPVPYLLNIGIWDYLNQLECGLATQDLSQPTFTLYPNPVKDEVHITVSTPQTTPMGYQLYTSLGQLVQKGPVENDATLNVQHLPHGLYFLKLKTVKGEQTLRLVKE
ncbi:MAG: serine hydrolase [Flavobacteriaceae bacterium]